MDREDDFDLGMRRRRAMLGDAWVERSLGEADVFTADFQALITRYAWHEIWNRPGLDAQTRRLLVLAITMATARWEEFELHCRAAVRGGVPWRTIQEVLLQGAIYGGVPSANTAFKITRRILQDEGVALPPAPLLGDHRVRVHRTFSAPSLRVALQGEDRPGVPVVLSHALGADLTMWDALAATLAERHPVLRYDHRGQGGSAVPAAAWTLDDLVDDAARVIGEWGRGPVVFVGLSMGGMVAQGLALRHPQRVRGVVLANTSARYPAAARQAFEQRADLVEAQGMAAVVDGVVERWLRPEVRAGRPEVERMVRHVLCGTDARAYAVTARAIAQVDWLDQLHRVACPTLVIAGRHDLGATPEMAEAIAAAVPRATRVVLEGASHLSVVEDPAGFGAALDRFLRDLTPAS